MSEKDVSYKNLTVPDAAAAYIAGKVDAAVVWQPWLYQLEKEKKGIVLFNSANIPGLIPDLLVFKADVAPEPGRGNPKNCEHLVRGGGLHQRNQADAVKIMAKVVEQKPEDYAASFRGRNSSTLRRTSRPFKRAATTNPWSAAEKQSPGLPEGARPNQEGAGLRSRSGTRNS